eukprot:GILI01000740.1.p1 GENE.GILI01000740.1~~GILI01000740.1.p1  ORF type:complete len:321 (+),score=117.19 GILI01000740.1:53-1015(+)
MFAALRQTARALPSLPQAVPALAPEHVRFASTNIKTVKLRMKSVGSIRKITKAMKMVAASKLRGDQRRLDIGRPFAVSALSAVDLIDVKKTVPEWAPAGSVQEKESTGAERVLYVALSSDRGLCGAVNSSVAREVRNSANEDLKQGKEVEVFPVGDKGKSALQRLFGDKFNRNIWEHTKNGVNFIVASAIADRIISSKFDSAFLLFNEFQSVIAFNTVKKPLLSRTQLNDLLWQLGEYEMEPADSDTLVDDLYQFYVASSVYSSLLENATSEQSARMSAMDNASKNAGEMIDKLTLQYNKARQAKITMELIEIISGANAV